MRLQKKLLVLAAPILQPLAKWYLSKPRDYEYHGIRLKIMPGVFHPGLFFSTKVLLQYISSFPLKNKRVLELGAGSGLISLYCAKQGANATASDINPTVVSSLRQNSSNNGLTLDVVESDLFEKLNPNQFDLIVVNPPYYPKDPKTIGEHAWFCGANFEYFEKLFFELHQKLTRKDCLVIMILSEDCRIDKIEKIAANHTFNLKLLCEQIVWGEKNLIFRIAR